MCTRHTTSGCGGGDGWADAVADTETNGLDPLGVTRELEDAGTSMMGGGFGSKSGTQGMARRAISVSFDL